MKKSFLLITALLTITVMSGSAWGFSLPQFYKLKYLNVEMLGPFPGGVAWDPLGLPTQIFSGLADGVEDNWGVAKLTTVEDRSDNSTYWSDGDNNEEVTFIFGGLDYNTIILLDTNLDGIPDAAKVKMSAAVGGAFLDMYIDDTSGGGYTAYDVSGGPGLRVGSMYPTVTDGTLLASFMFTPGIDPLNPAIVTDINQDTLSAPPTGDGSGYLDVVPGSGPLAGIVDTNGFTTPFGTPDVFLEFDFRPHPDPGLPDWGWDLNSDDPAIGNAVPEPTSITLFGLGLLGMSFIVRRKIKSKN